MTSRVADTFGVTHEPSEAWVATELNNEAARGLYGSLGGVEDPDHAIVYTWQLGSESGDV